MFSSNRAIQSETTKSNITVAANMVPEKISGKTLPDPTHDEKRDVDVTTNLKEINAASSDKVEDNTIGVDQNATKTTAKASVQKKNLDESSKVTK